MTEDNNKVGQRPQSSVHQLPPPDGGWGWVIVFSCFVALMIVATTFNGFSILYIEWVQFFDMESGKIGWLGSVYLCLGNLFSVFFALLVDVFGCRATTMVGAFIFSLSFFVSAFVSNIYVMYFTYGALAGVGFGLIFLPCVTIVHQYFDKNRGLAAGLSLCGLSVGALVAGPFYQLLVDTYGWRGVLIIMSGIELNMIAVGATFRPLNPKPKITSAQDSTEPKEHKSFKERLQVIKVTANNKLWDPTLFKDYSFLVFTFCCFVFAVGILPFNAHTPSRATFYGIERHQVALMPTYTGVATFASRLLFAFVANLECTNRLLLAAVALLAGGLTIVLFTLSTNYIYMVIFCAIFGFPSGCFQCVQTTVVVDIVGIERYTKAQALMQCAMAAGSLLGIPIAGYLFDITQNYNVPFIGMAIYDVVGGVLLMTVIVLQCRKRRQKQPQADMESLNAEDVQKSKSLTQSQSQTTNITLIDHETGEGRA